jgi:nucleoside-diphosphate-sugar epimerase
VCWQGGGRGIGDTLKKISKSGRFFTIGDKNPPVQLVHINDVIDACLNAIGKEGILDIASEEKMSLVELYEAAAKLGGKKPFRIKIPEKAITGVVWVLWKLGLSPIPPLYLKMFGYDLTRDLSKTVSVLGKPKYTIQQILKDIVAG